MARKTAAVKKKPSVHEISPKWLVAYTTINFIAAVAGFFATLMINKFKHYFPTNLFYICLCLPTCCLIMLFSFIHMRVKRRRKAANEKTLNVSETILNEPNQHVFLCCYYFLLFMDAIIIICTFYLADSCLSKIYPPSLKASHWKAGVKEKLVVYEISPKKILIYQIFNFIVGINAFVLSYRFNNPSFLKCYFSLLFMAIIYQCKNYFFGVADNLRSKIYYPGLLLSKEFDDLKKRFQKAAHKIKCHKSKRMPVPVKYQEIFDNLKSKIDEQNELHTVCWFNMLIGVQKFCADENEDVENEISTADESLEKPFEDLSLC